MLIDYVGFICLFSLLRGLAPLDPVYVATSYYTMYPGVISRGQHHAFTTTQSDLPTIAIEHNLNKIWQVNTINQITIKSYTQSVKKLYWRLSNFHAKNSSHPKPFSYALFLRQNYDEEKTSFKGETVSFYAQAFLPKITIYQIVPHTSQSTIKKCCLEKMILFS